VRKRPSCPRSGTRWSGPVGRTGPSASPPPPAGTGLPAAPPRPATAPVPVAGSGRPHLAGQAPVVRSVGQAAHRTARGERRLAPGDGGDAAFFPGEGHGQEVQRAQAHPTPQDDTGMERRSPGPPPRGPLTNRRKGCKDARRLDRPAHSDGLPGPQFRTRAPTRPPSPLPRRSGSGRAAGRPRAGGRLSSPSFSSRAVVGALAPALVPPRRHGGGAGRGGWESWPGGPGPERARCGDRARRTPHPLPGGAADRWPTGFPAPCPVSARQGGRHGSAFPARPAVTARPPRVHAYGRAPAWPSHPPGRSYARCVRCAIQPATARTPTPMARSSGAKSG